MQTGERYHILDGIRGAAVISMILYHAMWDVINVLGIYIPWYYSNIGYVWQQSICWTFILLSGACRHFSKRPLRHGLLVFGAGILVSLVTASFMPSETIRYGVLTLLGLSALLVIPLKPLLDRLPAGAGLAGSLVLFALLRGVPQGYLGFEGLRLCALPGWLYQIDGLAVLGLPGPTFISSDYFPLLPWFFLYLTGYFLWALVGSKPKVQAALQPQVPVLGFLGRHSLVVYLLHQPVVMGIFSLLGMVV